MKKHLFALLAVLSLGVSVWAQDVLYIHRADGIVMGADISSIDNISFNASQDSAIFSVNGVQQSVALANIDSLTFGDVQTAVTVTYAGTTATVVNPYAFNGVTVTNTSGTVVVTSTNSSAVSYTLSGSGTGSFKLYSAAAQTLTLNGVTLTSADGPAVNIQSTYATAVVLPVGTTSTLTDASTYTAYNSEDMKGTLFSEGDLIFSGSGALTVAAVKKHAIISDANIGISGGTFTVATSQSDAFHAGGTFTMTDGTINVGSISGDAVDTDGDLTVSGGSVNMTSSTADVKGLKSGTTVNISGGAHTFVLSGAQSKGIKAGYVNFTGGTSTFTMSGDVVYEDDDASYCTAVKVDSNLYVSGGTIAITHSGVAGKGFSVDGNAYLTGGTTTMTVSGTYAIYTMTTGAQDTLTATGIKVDNNLYVYGGTHTITATGTAGKGISVDYNAYFGESTSATGATLKVYTTGTAVSPSTGGGMGGQNVEIGSKPKAIKADGDIYINSGDIYVSTKNDGGEGIEAKDSLIINGGTVVAETYDDGLQGSNYIEINGGSVYSYGSNNDGMDSNGKITINGGVVVALGTTSPEASFDCDKNTFLINGGTVVGVAGSTSTPSSSSAQRVALYSTSAMTSGTTITVVKTSDNSHVLSFTLPRAYSSQMVMLMSSSLFTASTGYTIYTGGTVSGGTAFKGLTTGATYTVGTRKTTFTTSSVVTSVR